MNHAEFVTREALIELLEATLEEVKGNASFEGRIQYTCMVDDCPKGHFAVRAFVRTGNDMGQGGSMMVAGDVVIDAPPPQEPEEWEDRKDEWSDAIRDAYPTRSGSHMQYGQAMTLVGNRQSKGALVALVNWLLVRITKLEKDLSDHKVRLAFSGRENMFGIKPDGTPSAASLHIADLRVMLGTILVEGVSEEMKEKIRETLEVRMLPGEH